MHKNAPFSTTDSGHARAPDFSIPDAAAKRKAAALPHLKAVKGHAEQTTRRLSTTTIWRTSKAIKNLLTSNLLLTGALLATFAGGFLVTNLVFHLLLGS